MPDRTSRLHLSRRGVLAGVGAGLAGALIRPLRAQEAAGPPKRLLIVHFPCGTVLDRFFPSSKLSTDFQLPEITSPFAPLRQDMVLLRGVTCPRDNSWLGDQHAAGLITMMTGRKFVSIPGAGPQGDPNDRSIVAADKSIDQHLLASSPALRGGLLPSLQSTAYEPSSKGLPSFKVMSYDGENLPLFPEHDAEALAARLFGGLPAAQLARQADRAKVLSCVSEDLKRLQHLVPASQRSKLDAHWQALVSLQESAAPPVRSCDGPALLPLAAATPSMTVHEAQHRALARNQLALIQTAFQCDLTRVATFTFAHGNSDLRFKNILPNFPNSEGHHGTSHNFFGGDAMALIDQFYCEQLAWALQGMKNTPEGSSSLLDNTLVVLLSECAIGMTHSIEDMPVLMFGGKSLGLQTGRQLDCGGRYMNDVWSAVCGAFGAPPKFGDPAYEKGPVSGLFA